MKKNIFLLLIVAMVILTQNTYAQPNYYPNDSGIIAKNGYTYKYNIFSIVAKELYNANSTYKDVEMKNIDGTKMSEAMFLGKVETYSGANISPQQVFDIVSSKFTSEQKSIISEKLIISLTINPLTGKVADVYFTFIKRSDFTKIPVDVYRNIELALKSRLVFIVTDEGRKLNYLYINWSQEIK